MGVLDITPKHLVMVTASANNNKYYNMTPHGDTWTAEYGRIGSSSQKREYPMSQWNNKYQEKINKGYVDQSELVQDLIQVEKNVGETQYKQISNQSIAKIVERLQIMAKKAISDNYTISSNKVAQAMIDEAQKVLTSLITIDDIDQFNNVLLNLFSVIPRKMSNVSSYLAKSKDDYSKIIQGEQDLLDVMKGQVVQKIAEDNNTSVDVSQEQFTVLEALGLEFAECKQSDIDKIKHALGSCADKFHNAWKVNNIKTNNKYEKFVSDEHITNTKLLWHGSRNENWWSIINTGLVLKPTNAVITGKLYGMGIYFAPKARKSLGYTSLDGSYWAKGNSKSAFMALMEVAYGNPYNIYNYNYKYGSMNYKMLQEMGVNCLHAHAGADTGWTTLKNDEIVVYNEDQCTIRYLVELK